MGSVHVSGDRCTHQATHNDGYKGHSLLEALTQQYATWQQLEKMWSKGRRRAESSAELGVEIESSAELGVEIDAELGVEIDAGQPAATRAPHSASILKGEQSGPRRVLHSLYNELIVGSMVSQ